MLKFILYSRLSRLLLAGTFCHSIANLKLRTSRDIGSWHDTEMSGEIRMKKEVQEAKLEFMEESRAPP